LPSIEAANAASPRRNKPIVSAIENNRHDEPHFDCA
jgi:hypothetical protein